MQTPRLRLQNMAKGPPRKSAPPTQAWTFMGRAGILIAGSHYEIETCNDKWHKEHSEEPDYAAEDNIISYHSGTGEKQDDRGCAVKINFSAHENPSYTANATDDSANCVDVVLFSC